MQAEAFFCQILQSLCSKLQGFCHGCNLVYKLRVTVTQVCSSDVCCVFRWASPHPFRLFSVEKRVQHTIRSTFPAVWLLEQLHRYSSPVLLWQLHWLWVTCLCFYGMSFLGLASYTFSWFFFSPLPLLSSTSRSYMLKSLLWAVALRESFEKKLPQKNNESVG